MASIEYLKSFSLGKNYRTVFAWKKVYETNKTATAHLVTLVSDENDKEYLFDATPTVGYKCGIVECVNKNSYEDFIEIKGELKEIYETIREIKYICFKCQISEKKLCEYLKFLEYAKKYDVLKEYIEDLKLILFRTSKIDIINNDYEK